MSQFSIFHSYFFVVKVQVKFLIYVLKYILFCITIFFISIFLFTFFTHKKILLHASPFFGNRDDSGTCFAPFSRPVIVKMFKSTHSFLLLKYELVSVCVCDVSLRFIGTIFLLLAQDVRIFLKKDHGTNKKVRWLN